MRLEQTWRWYGPRDGVSLQDVRQAGATGIVSALHHIPHGAVWPLEEVQQRKKIIEDAGLVWSVVESVTVHEDIKTRTGNCEALLEDYRQTLRNLGAAGIRTVCYNFMPVLDWTRTQLDYEVADGSKALRFDWTDLAVFDVYLLKRAGAEADYEPEVLERARQRFEQYSESQRALLSENVLMGIPGESGTDPGELLRRIETYKHIGADGLRENLAYFLESIMDTCEEQGIRMTIHPDDPPFAILGLPRVVSSEEDLSWLLKRVDRKPNGICYCTGSLGAGKHNDLVSILKTVGERVYFVHLRNVKKEQDRSFYEADHLDGDNDMYTIMKTLLEFQQRRSEPIPFRPDHGHQMLDDLKKQTFPGYSAIGRLRGLAELRGLELGISGTL
ncbi:mannonate dehydratase [Compostibacter hankyongensis]|uniref:Mannonate dehydratase n=1 Tax=Compostibacter hankyongensis TaxID=1007089 RepID=A0ABP8FUU4_9BACT